MITSVVAPVLGARVGGVGMDGGGGGGGGGGDFSSSSSSSSSSAPPAAARRPKSRGARDILETTLWMDLLPLDTLRGRMQAEGSDVRLAAGVAPSILAALRGIGGTEDLVQVCETRCGIRCEAATL